MSVFRTILPVDPFGWPVPDLLPPTHPKVILVIGEPSEHALFPLLSSRHLRTSLVLIATHVPPIIPGDHTPTVRVLRLIDPLVADTSALRLMNLFERAQAIASTPSNNQRFLHFSESYSGGDFLISPTSPHAGDVNRLFASSQLSLHTTQRTKPSRKQPIVRERVTFDAIINFLSPNVSEKVLLRHAILVTTLGAQYLAPSSASLSPTYFPLLATPVVKRSRFSFLTSPSAVTLPDQNSKPKKRFSLFRFSSSSTVQVNATNSGYSTPDKDNDDPSAASTRVATLWTASSHAHSHPHSPSTTGNPTSLATATTTITAQSSTSPSTFRIHLVHVLPDGWIPESSSASSNPNASRYRTYSGPSHSHTHTHSYSYSSSSASTPDSSRYPSRASSPLATRPTAGPSPPPLLNAYAHNRVSAQQPQSQSMRTRRGSLTQRHHGSGHVRVGSGGSTLNFAVKPKLAQSIEQFVLSFAYPAAVGDNKAGWVGGYYDSKKRPMSVHAFSTSSALGAVQEESKSSMEKDLKIQRPGTASSIMSAKTASRNLNGKGSLSGEGRQKPIPYVVGPGVWSAYIPGTSSGVFASPSGGTPVEAGAGAPLMHVRELTVGEMIVLGGVDDESTSKGSGLSVPPGRAWIGSVDELVVVKQQRYQRGEAGETEKKETKLAPVSTPAKPESQNDTESVKPVEAPKQDRDVALSKKAPLESLPTPPQSSSSSEGGDDDADDGLDRLDSGHVQVSLAPTSIPVPVPAPSLEPIVHTPTQPQIQHSAPRPGSFVVTPSPVDSFPSLVAVSEGSSSSSVATPSVSGSASREGSVRASDSEVHGSVRVRASDSSMVDEKKELGMGLETPKAVVVRARPVQVDDPIPASPVAVPVVPFPAPISTSSPTTPVRIPASARIPAPQYTIATSTMTPMARKTVSDNGHGSGALPVAAHRAKHTRSGSDPSSNGLKGGDNVSVALATTPRTEIPSRKLSVTSKRRGSIIGRISRSISGGKDKDPENVKPQYHYKKASEYREEEMRKEREEEAKREKEREREKEVIRLREIEKGRSEREWGSMTRSSSQSPTDPLQSRIHPQTPKSADMDHPHPSPATPSSNAYPHPNRPAPPPPSSPSRPAPPALRSLPHAHHYKRPTKSSSISPGRGLDRHAPLPQKITLTEHYSRYPVPSLMRSASSGGRSLSRSPSGSGSVERGRGGRMRDSEELWGGRVDGDDDDDMDRLQDERRLYAEFHPLASTAAAQGANSGLSILTRKGSVGLGTAKGGVGRKLVKKGSLSGGTSVGQGDSVPSRSQSVRVVA